MSTTISYPSALVPEPPPVRLQMPAGWSQVWVPDTLIAIRDDVDTGHFLANVVVRCFHRVHPFGPEEIRTELDGYARQRTSGELGPSTSRAVVDREFHGAEVTFADAEAGEIGQTHWFTVRAHHDLLAVIQLTGSYAADRRETDLATIDRIFESIRIDP